MITQLLSCELERCPASVAFSSSAAQHLKKRCNLTARCDTDAVCPSFCAMSLHVLPFGLNFVLRTLTNENIRSSHSHNLVGCSPHFRKMCSSRWCGLSVLINKFRSAASANLKWIFPEAVLNCLQFVAARLSIIGFLGKRSSALNEAAS